MKLDNLRHPLVQIRSGSLDTTESPFYRGNYFGVLKRRVFFFLIFLLTRVPKQSRTKIKRV